jgi:hypothetical protein
MAKKLPATTLPMAACMLAAILPIF